ncbi:MAG: metallophosphoesterase [Gammaproteobacteria bacterium]|nr:metallophosphoesterase [Gammaproteobacteria bacterium]
MLLITSCQKVFALSEKVSSASETFLSVADIHFTPFTSCKVLRLTACPLIVKLMKAKYEDWKNILENDDNKAMSTYGQDTNYFLLKSSLSEIQNIRAKEKTRFTLILGDFLAHNYREQYVLYSHDHTQAGYNNFVKKTLQFLTAEIRQAIPAGDIYPAIGNNDSYTGDYSVVPHGVFFQETEKTWSVFIKDENNLKSFQKSFSTAGYYSITSPINKNMRIIVLDTVLFSSSATTDQDAAHTELQWFSKELGEAAKQKQHVLIAFHIPVGVDVYRTLKKAFGGIKEFWQPEFTNLFQTKLQEYPGLVTAILPGHIHMDTFQVLSLSKVDDVPVSYTPSISPIFGNNPAFKIYSYDPVTIQLKNYETYYYPLNDAKKGWQQEYSFNSTYKFACTDCDLKKRMQQFTSEKRVVSLFREYYAVGKHGQPIAEENNWQHYWCHIRSFTKSDFKTCIDHPL